MRDQDVITRLEELHDHIQAPATPAGEDVSRGKRLVRRRRAISVMAAAAVGVVVVGITQASLSDGQRSEELALNPSRTQAESPLTGGEWTPERIRAEGTFDGERLATASGLTVRVYAVCDGVPCDWDRNPLPEMKARAVEVSQGGRSAVFDVAGFGNIGVDEVDDDSVLVADAPGAPGTDPPARYRLLGTDGTAMRLQMVDDPVPALAGPDVVVHNVNWSAGGAGDGLYVIDRRAATLRPLDLPPDVGGENGVRYWGPNVDEFLWGVTDDCRVFWQTDDDTFTEHSLDCDANFMFTEMQPTWFPAGWLQPGRMAVAEQRDDGVFLHVSFDGGVNWQRIPVVSDEGVDGLPTSSDAAVADVLAGLD